MITTTDFLREVAAIAQSNPTYRTGGRGADGTCDCVGLIMGAMYANGHAKYPMHSTNYFARYETDGLVELDSDTTPNLGAVVYKARQDTGQLNDRYKAGGRYYTGDVLDYYHMGVVTNIDPLEITHCTESNSVNGIAYDVSLRGWTHAGWVKGVTTSEDGYEEGETSMSYKAMVFAAEGRTVNLRKRPNSSGDLLDRVPIGAEVTVNESAQGWAQVSWNGKTGYMMDKFLTEVAEEDNDAEEAAPHPSDAEGYSAIIRKLDEILQILKGKSTDGAREEEAAMYTDTE